MARVKEYIAHHVRRLREERDWTIRETAAAIEMEEQTVINYENPKTPGFNGNTLARYARAFSVEESELVKPPAPTVDETAIRAAEVAIQRCREIALIPKDILAAAADGTIKAKEWDIIRERLKLPPVLRN